MHNDSNWTTLAMRMDQMKLSKTEKEKATEKFPDKKDTGTGLDVMGPVGPSLWAKPGKDKLNLTGLLNVMDGVVDTPGRILIMTTNHPEMLDPAIIRPGRIDKRIMLGYMQGSDVISMLEHYFQVILTEDQRNRVEVAITGDGFNHPQVRMTPAQVEQMTAEHDEIEDMIQALEAKSHPMGSVGNARSKATITYNV
jgi:chaperone BCS1